MSEEMLQQLINVIKTSAMSDASLASLIVSLAEGQKRMADILSSRSGLSPDEEGLVAEIVQISDEVIRRAEEFQAGVEDTIRRLPS